MTALTQRPTIVLTAGGTGGHVFPARALAEQLRTRGHRVALITDARAQDWLGDWGVETHVVRSATFAGRSMLRKVSAVGDIAAGAFQARALLRQLNACIVVGFGGYPAVPGLLAAFSRRLPTVIHEQNAILGRVNRKLARRVTAIAASFADTGHIGEGERGRTVVTGNPVRGEIALLAHQPYPMPTENGLFRILVLGGSQGAQVMGEIVPQALLMLPPAFRARLSVVQQVRAEALEEVRATYAQAGIMADLAPFFDDMPRRLAQAHLVVARAGASSIAELAAAGRPSILVPLPSAADDHQTANARALDAAGGAWLVPQPSFTPAELAKRIQKLSLSPGRLADAAAAAHGLGVPDAALRLADLVETTAGAALAGGGAIPVAARRAAA
ncbi:undecaprenyldiphospho-muramoylpentapeptide beta-N-acetylglucosaminyltransferase [Zavarzinia sp. CC-PAN008]|uniref:undecaprenyldiphospho-muramoylpentapeptide beta-N-acetylglucosaminyltransferase n=1 Tax=Zavarzinia sp. CC-PAN008 TaxID=3243332 RepID=UPI003F742069